MKEVDLDLNTADSSALFGGRRKNESEEWSNVKNQWLDRRIYKLYELGAQWAPIPLMLTHWYGVWDYGHYPRAIIVDTANNGYCIVWLYFLAYIFMPLAMLPVSYFFHYCWLFRVPFIYFIGINAIRAYYRHWLITPEMIEGHHILIVFILFLYAYGFVKIACERSKVCA